MEKVHNPLEPLSIYEWPLFHGLVLVTVLFVFYVFGLLAHYVKSRNRVDSFWYNSAVYALWPNLVYASCVRASHFVCYLLDVNVKRNNGLYGFHRHPQNESELDESVEATLAALLRWVWHFAIIFPILVVVLVAAVLGVGFHELVLFYTVASATVALEVCIGVVLHKSELINDLSRQSRRVLKKDLEMPEMIKWITVYQHLHRKARLGIAKAALITGVSFVLYSSVVVLEVLRMKQAEGLLSQNEIAAVLAKFTHESLSKETQTSTVQSESTDATFHHPLLDIQINSGDRQCQMDFNKAADSLLKAQKDAHEENISPLTVIVSIMCSTTLLLLSGRKLWVVSRNIEEEDFIDQFTSAEDASNALGLNCLKNDSEYGDTINQKP